MLKFLNQLIKTYEVTRVSDFCKVLFYLVEYIKKKNLKKLFLLF